MHEGSVAAHSDHPAPVINIRLETKPESRTMKWLGVAAVLSAVACTIVAGVSRQSSLHLGSASKPGDVYRGYRAFLQLGPEDNYVSTIRKLGLPARTSTAEASGNAYRALAYPSRHYSVILMGASQDQARYVGTVDQYGRVLDGNYQILRTAPAF